MPEVRQPPFYDAVFNLRRAHRQRLARDDGFLDEPGFVFRVPVHSAQLRLPLKPAAPGVTRAF